MGNLFTEALNYRDNLDRFERINSRLNRMGLNLSNKKDEPYEKLFFEANVIEVEADNQLKTAKFNESIKNPSYGRKRLMVEALRCLAEHKKNLEDNEPLIEGVTYYKDIKNVNGIISGNRCTYLGEQRRDSHNWVEFKESARKLKILETLRIGTDEDFSHLYFDLADGKPFVSNSGFYAEHITESSQKALRKMEKYCDDRWEGAWPWESVTPTELKHIIEENTQMRNERIATIRKEFERTMVELTEGEVEKTEVIIATKEIADKITNMIQQLGRISAETLTTLKDKIRTEFGEDAAHRLEKLSNEKIGNAVDILSELRQAFKDDLDGGDGGDDEGENTDDLEGDSFSDSIAKDINGMGSDDDDEDEDEDSDDEDSDDDEDMDVDLGDFEDEDSEREKR